MYVEILAEVVDGSSILGIIGRREVLTASEPETPKHVLPCRLTQTSILHQVVEENGLLTHVILRVHVVGGTTYCAELLAVTCCGSSSQPLLWGFRRPFHRWGFVSGGVWFDVRC